MSRTVPLGRLLAFAAAVALVCAAPAFAADVTVTSCNDPSLRQAIDDVPDGGTIDFGCSGNIIIDSGTGPVQTGKSFTLDGSGRQVTITGRKLTRLFFLSGNGRIVFRNLSLTNGYSDDTTNGGGAVTVINTTFVADGVRFAGNFAESRGGAISVLGTVGGLEVTDSTFDGNGVQCGSVCIDGGGGAIAVAGGKATRIERSTFRSNTSLGRGGGGAVLGRFTNNVRLTGALSVTDSTFEGNTANALVIDADRPMHGGGAIEVASRPFTVERSTFTRNVTTDALPYDFLARGGAIAMGATPDSPAGTFPASISDSTFSQNSAAASSADGGAIANALVPLTIARSRITGNDASTGGGLWAFGPTTVTDSLIAGNVARGNSNGDGGGVMAGGRLTLAGTDVLDNDPTGCQEYAFSDGTRGEIVDGGGNFESPGATCGFAAIARPVLTAGDVRVRELEPGELSEARFRITLSEPLARDLEVAFTTVDDSARSGQDYDATSGSFVIPAGATTDVVEVNVDGDDEAEPEETFALQLSLPESGRVVLGGGGRGTATIADDDTPATPSSPPAPQPPPPARDVAPVVFGQAVRPDEVPAGKKVRVLYSLTEPASVTFAVDSVGRKGALKRIGTLARDADRGANSTSFRTVGGRALAPGLYRVVITPRDAAGNVGIGRTAKFRVLAPAPKRRR